MPEIERLFGSVASVEQAATAIRRGARGRVKVAAASTLAMSLVAHAVGRFNQSHPEVMFDIRALPTRHVVEYVNTNQVDMGILDIPVPTGDLEVEEFCTSEIGCILHKNHRLAQKKQLTPKDLIDQPLLSFSEETLTAWRLREAFRAYGVPYVTKLVSNSTITVYSMIEQLQGVALVDTFALTSNAWPDLVVRRFIPKIEVKPRLLFLRGRPRSLIMQEFSAELRQSSNSLKI